MDRARVIELVEKEIMRKEKIAKLLELNDSDLAEYHRDVAEAFSQMLDCYKTITEVFDENDNLKEKEFSWDVFVKQLKGNVPPACFPYLENRNKATGEFIFDTLFIFVDSDFTKSMLDKPSVKSKISECVEQYFGKEKKVVIYLRKGDENERW